MRTDGINEVVVSTIIEHLFQYFDEDLIAKNRRYRQLEREIKLRSALFVFDEMGLSQFSDADKSSALIIVPDVGLAQPSEADKSLPMLVPTRHFLKLLETSRLTTLVKPLNLPVCIYIPRSEAKKHDDYTVDFRRSFESVDDVVKYLARMRGWLYLSELGWAEHRRGDDGRLCWDLTKLGIENQENGTFERLAFSGKPYGRN